MKIFIVTPAPRTSRTGNRTTALRWARLLKNLGHNVTVATEFDGRDTDLMIALHAQRSHSSIVCFKNNAPHKPLIVALTGTDVYGNLQKNTKSVRSMALADRLLLLQPSAADMLVGDQRAKARVVYQSAVPPNRKSVFNKRTFDVCVVGHLRTVKDPFRAAMAVRDLPEHSRIRIVHVGEAMNSAMQDAANREMGRNPRYRWIGGRPQWQARMLLANSRVMVLSSRAEGGANVISEAAVAAVPVLASHIPGSVGLLGASYPGYFPAGDTRALRELLLRVETESRYLGRLKKCMVGLKRKFTPAAEQKALKQLLAELT